MKALGGRAGGAGGEETGRGCWLLGAMCGVCLVGRSPALGEGCLDGPEEACAEQPGELGLLARQGPAHGKRGRVHAAEE